MYSKSEILLNCQISSKIYIRSGKHSLIAVRLVIACAVLFVVGANLLEDEIARVVFEAGKKIIQDRQLSAAPGTINVL